MLPIVAYEMVHACGAWPVARLAACVGGGVVLGPSRLINRNVTAGRGRTSMRLEPELWDALEEICQRENVSVGEIVRRIEGETDPGGRTSAVRVYVLRYFREAATPEGHAAVGHGPRPQARPVAIPRAAKHDNTPEA